MSADYGPAQWMPTSHYWQGRGGHAPKWIIIHGTAGGSTAQGIAQWFQTDDPPTSAHYIVGLNGEVVQCVAEANSAWANGVVTQGHDPWWSPSLNPNFLTFSIEHVKPDTDNRSQLTQAQKEASFALIQHLCDTYNIPKRAADANGGIAGHNSIDPVNRADCPNVFPWDELWGYLDGGANTVGVPSGWHDDGTHLTAPNGKQVMNGFRWWLLTHAWASDNWPLENEYYVKTLDITNPSLGSGTVQHFRRNILAWQEHTSNVIDLWSGAVAQAWEQRAVTAENSNKASSFAPVQSKSAAPTSSAASASAGPAAEAAPIAYMPPLKSAQQTASAAPRTTASAGAAPAAGFSLGAVTTAVADIAGVAGGAGDPLAQRISGIEQQLSQLLDSMNASPAAKKNAKKFGTDLENAAKQLENPTVRRTLFGNPKSLLRWVLMIVGLLFSDAVAWAISTFLHHQTTLPVPFLTVGTVLLSGVVFMGAFRMTPKH